MSDQPPMLLLLSSLPPLLSDLYTTSPIPVFVTFLSILLLGPVWIGALVWAVEFAVSPAATRKNKTGRAEVVIRSHVYPSLNVPRGRENQKEGTTMSLDPQTLHLVLYCRHQHIAYTVSPPLPSLFGRRRVGVYVDPGLDYYSSLELLDSANPLDLLSDLDASERGAIKAYQTLLAHLEIVNAHVRLHALNNKWVDRYYLGVGLATKQMAGLGWVAYPLRPLSRYLLRRKLQAQTPNLATLPHLPSTLQDSISFALSSLSALAALLGPDDTFLSTPTPTSLDLHAASTLGVLILQELDWDPLGKEVKKFGNLVRFVRRVLGGWVEGVEGLVDWDELEAVAIFEDGYEEDEEEDEDGEGSDEKGGEGDDEKEEEEDEEEVDVEDVEYVYHGVVRND
ncbi:hypothetical protein HDV05_002013 [Chytridiales sp. JEL 0842]|nr:hypothetical protein HDV05_002013 [Chytridiales sp. JEL 0842]